MVAVATGANSVESQDLEREVCHSSEAGLQKESINLSLKFLSSPIFGLLQNMNLLPELESPVTRQEKMATVWDEAEVRAGRAGGPRAGDSGNTPLAGG